MYRRVSPTRPAFGKAYRHLVFGDGLRVIVMPTAERGEQTGDAVMSDAVIPPSPDQVDPRAALRELDDFLGRNRFVARSSDGAVKVTADGRGALLDISVDYRVLRSVRFPEQVGGSILAAVTFARRQAGRVSRQLMNQILDPARPNPDLSSFPPLPEFEAPAPTTDGSYR